MSISLQNPKIALVHDWLTEIGGAQRVLKALHEMFPAAPVYVLFYDKKFADEFMPGAEIIASHLQKWRRIAGKRLLAPFSPLAAESLDLREYDVVISTSPFSQGLILRSKTTHISYCHSPTRQLWDWQAEYRAESHKAPLWAVSLFQHFTRIWDRHASQRVDYFIANSKNTQSRIRKYYNRDSVVVYPPVDTADDLKPITHNLKLKTYFLIVSRLFPHKNIHFAVRAFNKLGWPLYVIGDGPEKNRLQKLANSSADIVFLGHQPENVVRQYYSECTAFIMPQEEDFGIAPLEAMSRGKPVLALKEGGALEYIEEGVNGEFFEDPCEEMLADGVRRLVRNLPGYDPDTIKKTAERFTRARFEKSMVGFLESTGLFSI